MHSICHLLLPCAAILSPFFWHHKIFPLYWVILINIQYVTISPVLKIKTPDSTYLISYCLISLFFTAKYFEWCIFAISNFPLFLPEFPPVRHLHHCSKTEVCKFTNGFFVAKSSQFLFFILLDLSVSFDIILSPSSLKVFLYLVSKTPALTWFSFHFAG